MEGTDISPEKLKEQIAEFRRSAGLTHCELARMLDMPVCFTEILENGILVRSKDEGYTLWKGNLFTRRELDAFAAALKRVNGGKPEGRNTDEEFVFYCPVTVSSFAIERDMKAAADVRAYVSSCEKQIACMLGMKARLYYRQMCMCGRKNAAEMIMQRVFELLNRGIYRCR